MGGMWGQAVSDEGVWYPGNNTTPTSVWYDRSGSAHDGTLTNFDYTDTSGWGSSPPHLIFDGSNDHVVLPDLGVAEDGIFSYEAWASTSATAIKHMVSEGGTSGNYASLRISSAGAATFQMSISSSASSAIGATVNNGSIHHLVGTCDGTTLKVYADGVAGTSSAIPAGTLATTTSYVGRYNTVYFAGSIYVARMYSTALTAAQVAQNYAAGYTGIGYVKDNLVLDLAADRAWTVTP